MGAGRGQKGGGGETGTVNGRRRRHAARGAGTSGGGWQVVDTGDVQVGGASHQERKWVAGVNERDMKMKGCGWGGGRKEGVKNYP